MNEERKIVVPKEEEVEATFELVESTEKEVGRLMTEIDEKINRFVELTGAKGKVVKKRWRDIKKGRTEKVTSDRVAELEKAVRDYYVRNGATLGDGTWEFQVSILTEYSQKNLRIVLAVEGKEPFVELEVAEARNTKEMFDKAFEYFAV